MFFSMFFNIFCTYPDTVTVLLMENFVRIVTARIVPITWNMRMRGQELSKHVWIETHLLFIQKLVNLLNYLILSSNELVT